MNDRANGKFEQSALRLLEQLALKERAFSGMEPDGAKNPDVSALIDGDLATREPNGMLRITAVGRAHLARAVLRKTNSPIDPFRGQHLGLNPSHVETPTGMSSVLRDDAESPLAWLARRKGRDGMPLIAPHQLQSGERLRSAFTRAQLMPRTTANWDVSIARDRRGGETPATISDVVISARQQVHRALDAVGPEFSGLLLDVCCFLKRLEDVERERNWPARSAKIVLQLALDCLARHYGLAKEARGRSHTKLQTWLAPDAKFVVE